MKGVTSLLDHAKQSELQREGINKREVVEYEDWREEGIYGAISDNGVDGHGRGIPQGSNLLTCGAQDRLLV